MLETGRQDKELEGLSLLGNQGTKYKFGYDPNILEVFDNKHPNNDYFVKFNCPEFTSLCPITGQPDFATIYISYIPGEKMVESKSLKLYLFTFRNHGDFHEDCMNIIMKDLIIIGAGGVGQELIYIINQINKKEKIWNVLGFVEIPGGISCLIYTFEKMKPEFHRF